MREGEVAVEVSDAARRGSHAIVYNGLRTTENTRCRRNPTVYHL
jgi:hypothetical protein